MVTSESRAAKWAMPSMLSWEREQIGLALEDAAGKLGEPPGLVRAWEEGGALPSLADLRRLADLYFCPVGHFFADSPQPREENLDFRGLDETKTLSHGSRKQIRRFVRLMETASDWRRRLGAPLEMRVPSLPLRQPQETAEALTAFLGVDWASREAWGSPDEAFAGWRAAIEERNIFVFSFALPLGEARGASTWTEDGAPGILVNRSDVESATGRIFTLLHEFTHLLVRRAGIVCDFRGQQEIETFANRVAARALAPVDKLRDRLSEVGLDSPRAAWRDADLDAARTPFHASRDTILILLEEIGLAERGYYRQRRAAWDKRKAFGRRKAGTPVDTKPVRKFKELGARMSNLALSAAESGLISPLDVAEVLDMPLRRLPEFAQAARGQ